MPKYCCGAIVIASAASYHVINMHVNSVDRIRKRFSLEGESPALNRKPRATPPTPPKLDGHDQTHTAIS